MDNRTHRIVADIGDSQYVALARAKMLVRRMFGLDGIPTNSQVVGWLLDSVPWDELEKSRPVHIPDPSQN